MDFYKYLLPFHKIIGRYPKIIYRLRYYHTFGRTLKLKHPVYFFDKLAWLSFNTDTSLWSTCADKYAVREYVKSKYSDRILTKLYGVYERVEDIDYDSLPDSFVMKTNNGCASNVFVKNKKDADLSQINKTMDFWLHYPYGELTGQIHYTRIKPLIIAEEFLTNNEQPDKPLIDYKFYCFNGEPQFCMAMSDRIPNTHDPYVMMYDMEWNEHPEFYTPKAHVKGVAKPSKLSEMIEIAKALSPGFKFLRLDLYEVNGQVKFGEMTFLPGGGRGMRVEKQIELGNKIKTT